MNKNITAFLALALLSVGAAQAQTPPLKVATLTPLSGPQSDVGTQISNGAQLALSEYKPQFAKLGLTLTLQPYDDQADPATGTAAARKMMADSSLGGASRAAELGRSHSCERGAGPQSSGAGNPFGHRQRAYGARPQKHQPHCSAR